MSSPLLLPTDSRETDLSEVLQIEQIFTNVPKGLVAKKEDWVKAFNTDDMAKVIEEVSHPEATTHGRFCAREISKSTTWNEHTNCPILIEKSAHSSLR